MDKKPFAIEAKTLEDANRVDLKDYRFVEGLSAKRDAYVFVMRKKNEAR